MVDIEKQNQIAAASNLRSGIIDRRVATETPKKWYAPYDRRKGPPFHDRRACKAIAGFGGDVTNG